MSLTSILSYNNKEFKEFRDLLNISFPTPAFNGKDLIKAKPETKNYMLIGKAFDYLLRFNLEKKYSNKVFGREWVADQALAYFSYESRTLIVSTEEIEYDEYLRLVEEKKKKSELVHKKFNYAKNLYRRFIESELKDNTKLVELTLFLGRLDDVIRIGPFQLDKINFPPEDKLDIDDLKRLENICDLELFKPKNKIVLNPTFGNGSKLVGGADADIIIDETLIDIKVTKELRLTRPYFNQILGYYLLYLIGGVDQNKDVEIKNLGIYFARHNVLWTVGIGDIGEKPHFETAINLLKKLTKKTNHQQSLLRRHGGN